MSISDAQKRAVNEYQKKHLEIVSFRVKKGKRAAYNELAQKKNISLSVMLESYLDNSCYENGIDPNKYTKGGDNK